MHKQVIWSHLSKKDFVLILDYLQNNWDNKVIRAFIEITDRSIEQISNNPKQFPLINKNIRKCVLTKHNSLYYRDGKESIDILRIFDSRQDPQKMEFN